MYSEALAHFIDGCRAGDLEKAWQAAVGMERASGERLPLQGALRLLFLLGRERDPRFGPAARRWLRRLADESAECPVLIAAASSCLAGLEAGGDTARRCEQALVGLMSAPGDVLRPPASS